MGRGSEVQGTVQLLSCSGEKRFTEIFGTVHLEFCTGEEAYLTGLLHRDSGFGYSAELKDRCPAKTEVDPRYAQKMGYSLRL
jgi:hypothetical protein